MMYRRHWHVDTKFTKNNNINEVGNSGNLFRMFKVMLDNSFVKVRSINMNELFIYPKKVIYLWKDITKSI